jgi:glutamate 5-kinase
LKPSGKNYKRIVIKIGASLLNCDKNRLDSSLIDEIVSQVSCLVRDKKELVLVSSGAIACGMAMLGLESRPSELSHLQAVAAVGQHELMNLYRKAFKKRSLNCAQVLLTWEDFDDRRRYLNAKNTLFTLLKLGSVPIINENDTVSTDEIKFGDNDRLSALVSSLICADILIILSDVDGLLEKDRKTVIKVVDEITPRIKSLAHPTEKKFSVGGMITKIEAAKIAVDSGIPCVITNGRRRDVILSAIEEPQNSGTLFIPKKGKLCAKKRWIAFSAKPKGKITVDKGAKDALIDKKSLLCVGVIATEGIFESGDIVSVQDTQGYEFARGKVRLSSKQLDKVKGSHYDKEVIHRDNIVIL